MTNDPGGGVRSAMRGGAMLVLGMLTASLVIWSGMRLPQPAAAHVTSAPAGRSRVFWQLWFVFFLAAAAGLTVLGQAAGVVKAYGGSVSIAVLATTLITGSVAAAPRSIRARRR